MCVIWLWYGMVCCVFSSIDSDLLQGQWGKSRHSHRFALCCVALHILFNSTWIFMSVLFFLLEQSFFYFVYSNFDFDSDSIEFLVKRMIVFILNIYYGHLFWMSLVKFFMWSLFQYVIFQFWVTFRGFNRSNIYMLLAFCIEIVWSNWIWNELDKQQINENALKSHL